VGIDFHSVSQIYQGSRTHVLELFPRVAAIMPDVRFFVLSDSPGAISERIQTFNLANVELVHMPQCSPVKRLCWQLPLFQKQLHLDLLHTQYISPAINFCTSVVTIHDILFESHPQYFPIAFRYRCKLLVRGAATRQAQHVFTVSEFSKREIVTRYRVPPERVTVVPNGVDCSRFFPGCAGSDVALRYGLEPGKYLLSVGRLEPRKNLLTLLQAYTQLGPPKPPLVIVGQPHFNFDDLSALAEKIPSGRIVFCKDVSDSELPALYRNAALFLFPSWAEGFGIPVLEAFASGVPVVCSNTTSLPEITGGAAILVDPADPGQWSDAIHSVLASKERAESLLHAGLSRVTHFNWQVAAERVAAVYSDLLKAANCRSRDAVTGLEADL
jgi:glycosyltransferase involved in cell wall biosynthesis